MVQTWQFGFSSTNSTNPNTFVNIFSSSLLEAHVGNLLAFRLVNVVFLESYLGEVENGERIEERIEGGGESGERRDVV